MFQRSNAAFERAIALDPNRVVAASSLITNRVERGELGRAYDAATDLVRRQAAERRCAFRAQLCAALCGHAGTGNAGVQRGAVAGSGKLQFPVVRMGVSGAGQDRPGDGFRTPGRGLGVGGVGDAVCLSGGGECGAGAREREERGEGSVLSPGIAGGVHGRRSGRPIWTGLCARRNRR